MKRTNQGWRFIISFVLIAVAAISLMALFAIANESPQGNTAAITNMAFTSNLLASQNSKDSSSQEDDKPSKKPEPVYIMQAVSLSNVNDNTPGARQNIPFWERAFRIDEPLPKLNFFIPVLVIRVFAIFYRLARTGPGDDLPDHETHNLWIG